MARLSFNTQPPKGGWVSKQSHVYGVFGFNTQPPKGGWVMAKSNFRQPLRFNTQPPKGGWKEPKTIKADMMMFQHTAA